MIRNVIFDLDGTLMDTIEDLHFAMNEMLKKLNYPHVTHAQVRRFIGHGAREFVRLAVENSTSDEDKISECVETYSEIYNRYGTDRSKVFDGILPLIDLLKARGIKVAVLSNKPDAATNAVISKYFGDRFDLVVGQRPDFAPKPDPAGVRLVMEQLGASSGDTLFVGDGETDFLTAKNAGMPVVSVLWGYRDREELASYGATRFAESPAELQRWIETL